MHWNEKQKTAVQQWVKAGLGLSEIQSKLTSEFGISKTYMELRFLIDDLGVMPKDPEKNTRADEDSIDQNDLQKDAPETHEKVSVEVDSISRAGALSSGKVTFTDGQSAKWTLDGLGRFRFSPEEIGYKPSQEDWMEFQVQLQKILSGPRLGSSEI